MFMHITQLQFERISRHFPIQRGNVKINNLDFINALLYIVENGCKWRALPEKYGNWDTIYKKFNRWAKNNVIQKIFAALQAEAILAVRIEVLAVDSTSCKVHPNGHGALKKTENNPSENPREGGIPSFMWYPQMTRLSLKCTSPVENAMTTRKAVSAS
jgi:transposase